MFASVFDVMDINLFRTAEQTSGVSVKMTFLYSVCPCKII